VAALIDNLRMSYLLQIDDLLEVYRRIIAATQSHYNGILHLLSRTDSNESKLKEESQNYVDVTIEEKPTENRLAELHL
jgi:hypothetical protein